MHRVIYLGASIIARHEVICAEQYNLCVNSEIFICFKIHKHLNV